MKKKPVKTEWQFGENKIPVTIHREWRNSARASLRKSGLIIRLPSFFTQNQQEQQVEHFREWAAFQLKKSKAFQNHFKEKTYQSGDTLKVGERTYTLELEETDLQNHRGNIKNGVIRLRLSKNDAGENRRKSVRQLLSRLIAADFQESVERRVAELNHTFIRRAVKRVNLKYNHSNWGSCSHAGNINLSTRLLFAPEAVVDYVIVHELAHLVEPNHSERFWKVVSDIMPDYKEQEKWLRHNWHLCDF